MLRALAIPSSRSQRQEAPGTGNCTLARSESRRGNLSERMIRMLPDQADSRAIRVKSWATKPSARLDAVVQGAASKTPNTHYTLQSALHGNGRLNETSR